MSLRPEAVSLPSRFDFIRLEGFPLLPVLILAGFVFMAIFAGVLAPHDPEIGTLAARFRPPAWEIGSRTEHLLGTDHLGRDRPSRPTRGARASSDRDLPRV